MELRLARIFSYLMHPLLLPLYTVCLLLWSDPALQGIIPAESKLILAGIFFLVAVILPLFFTGILYRMRIISSLFLEKQEERIYPLLVTGVFYYLAFYLLRGIRISPAISLFMLGTTLLVVVALILTFYRKISLHMMGLGGMVGWAAGFPGHFGGMPVLFFAMILISGLVGTARLALGAHKSAEVYAGFLVGAAGMFLLSLFG